MNTNDEGRMVELHHSKNEYNLERRTALRVFPFVQVKLEQVLMILEDIVIRIGGSRNRLRENRKNFQAW
jgi:hypothetical protein